MSIKIADKFFTRMDGWFNLLTGLGRKGIDKRINTTYSPNVDLDEETLISIYRFDGMGARIIDCFTEDMTRKWFKVKGDTDDAVNTYLNKIDGKPAIIEALRWSLLMGGSVIIVGIDDGGRYEDPVDETNINTITHLHVYDRWRAVWTTADLYADPTHPKFGTPEWYTIFPINPAGAIGLTPPQGEYQVSSPRGNTAPTIGSFRVHETRILRFDGKQIPLKARIRNRYWSDSILATCYERIRGLGEGFASIESIIGEFIIGVMKIDNLTNLLAGGKEDLVHKRLQIMDMCRRTMATKLIEKDEDYTRVTSTVSGLSDLIDKLVEGASCASGIPVTRLVGRSPAGENSTGEGDEAIYYDKVEGMENAILLPPEKRLVRYIMLAHDSPFKGIELKDWQIEYLPLKAMTAKEQAELEKAVAEKDHIYITDGVLGPGEVAESRYGGDSYSTDTHLTIKRDADGELPPSEEDIANQKLLEKQLESGDEGDSKGDEK
jgi:phage-related protein (TIGR01555 family)